VRSELARHSALYEGTVVHSRRIGTPHAFTRTVYLHYLDLDELAHLHFGPILAQRIPSPLWFRFRDYFDGTATPIDAQVRRIVNDQLGFVPGGPIRLLTSLRTWWWCFNPITVAYVFDATGERVEAIVASVTNTPWGERVNYVLDARGGMEELAPVTKRMQVSPFFGSDGAYEFTMSEPGEHLAVSIALRLGSDVGFKASLRLRRRPLTVASTVRVLASHPFSAHRTSLGIYLQALKLWRKGAPTVTHVRP